MRITTRLKIDLSFGAAVLLLVAVGLVSFRSMEQVRRSQERVARAEEVLRKIESVESLVKAAEASLRAYLITEQEEFLGPYGAALEALPAERRALRTIVSDNPSQGARLEAVDSLLDQRMALLAEVLERARAGEQDRDAIVIRTRAGQRVMVQLLAAGESMRAEEFTNLQERQVRAATTAGLTILLVLFGSAVAILVVAASRQSLVRELRAREEAEAALAVERQEASDELRRREERYRGLVERASDIIYTSDAEGRFTYVNPVAVSTTGFPEEQLLGTHYLALVDPEWRERTKEFYLAQARDRVDETYYEFPIRTRDGRTVWLGQNVRLLVSHSGDLGAQAVARDITRALELERMKDSFLSIVSHELRTPLTAIRGSLGLLAGGQMGTLDERGKRMLEIAAQNTDRLVRLINDLLDIEKIESGKVQMEKEEVELSQLTAGAVETLHPLADRAGVHLEADVPPVTLHADPDRIVQVLTNLVSNAVKFSSEGGRVDVRGVVRNGEVEVTVADTGRGIPADKLDSIFERFEQVDSTDARQKGGTGLGLAIARSIVQQHGGRIWVESQWGQGSTFHFTLPLGPVTTGAAAAGPLVLVCDDDPGVGAYVTTILRRAGYAVAIVGRGEEVVPAAREQRPAAILLDVTLPGMSGSAVLGALRADPDLHEVPVVMVTGANEREAGIEPAEVVGWVEKPIDREALLRVVESAVAPAGARCDVLLVEDDPDLARVITEMLRGRGLSACVARDGMEAVELSRRLRFSLLILDPGLPGLDGFEVVDWMRRHDRHRSVPIVVYTAGDLDDAERDRLRLGPTEFLTKARNPLGQLGERVEALLGRVAAGSRDGG